MVKKRDEKKAGESCERKLEGVEDKSKKERNRKRERERERERKRESKRVRETSEKWMKIKDDEDLNQRLMR